MVLEDTKSESAEAARAAVPERHGVMTNSSLRLLRWMTDYAELMRCGPDTVEAQSHKTLRACVGRVSDEHCSTSSEKAVADRKCVLDGSLFIRAHLVLCHGLMVSHD